MEKSITMASQDVKISIVMPAYNVDSYIDEAIQSTLAQKGVSFELLIGDDGSTDQTWKWIKAYQKDPRVRSWKFHKNRGASVTRNSLIAYSHGSYIAACDADDVMLPKHLKTLAQVLDREPEIGVVYGNLIEELPSGKHRPLPRSPGHTKTWDLIDGSITNVGTLVRRKLIQKIGGYRCRLPFLEDCDLFLRLAEITQFKYLKNKPSYLYRRHHDSLSDQPKQMWKAVGQKIIKDAIFRRYGTKVKW